MQAGKKTRSRWRVRWQVAAVTFGLCAAVWVSATVRVAPEIVEARGSAAELGRQAAAPVSWKTKLLVSGYLETIVCGGEAAKQARAKSAGAQIRAQLADPYRQELDAFAAEADVDADMLAFGNAFVDLGSRALGCRSTIVAGDRLLHAHNLDWDNLGGMAKWSVTVTRRFPDDGRYRTVAVGFPGLVGVLDVINEHGVALSFNQLGTGSDEVTEPVFVMMRRIAETCATFAEAEAELLAAPSGMPFIITVSSAKEGKGAIFERWRNAIEMRDLNADGWVAAANGQQGNRHGISCLGRVLARDGAPADVAAMQIRLRDPDVLAAFNLYSVIFDFTGNRLHLASGSLPAAAGSYRSYPLF